MATTAPLGKMIVELGLDSTDFGKSLQSSKREVKYWASDMKASMRAADLAGNTLGKFEAKHRGLTSVINAQRKSVDRIKKSYDNSFVDGKPTAQTEKLAAQLRNAESQLINYNKQLVDNAGSMARWKVENEGLTGGLNRLGGVLSKRGKQMSDFGDKMTTHVSLPIAAGVGLAVKAAVDWESAFTGVKKTNDEVVDSNGNVVYSYADLEEGLRGLAKELPSTHAEIAGVAEAAGQLGIQTDNVKGFTKTMIDLGESTNMTADEAATAFARLANVTGMSQKDFDRLGSTVVDLGNNFATTESEITELALRLSGIGKQVGLSEADIVGIAAAMSSVGIEAEAGGTAMTMAMKKMQNAVSEGGKDLEGFADVAGMTAGEFAEAFEKDPARALQAFVEGLQRASDDGENLNGVLGDLGIKGIRESDTLLRLAGNSELLGKALDQSGNAWEENSALSEEARKRYETTQAQLEMLRNEVIDLGIEFGGPLVEAFRDGITVARPFIERIAELAEAFSDADPEMQKTILKMIGMTVAAGPLLSITGRVASGFGGLTTKTIGLLGVLAQKKTIKEFSAQLLTGSTDIMKFGGAAATASGPQGVGAMTTSLGLLGPVGWGIVGAGGLLAVGYGAWKLWGEEAYNSAERTKQWGTDVGSVVDKNLDNMQRLTNESQGQFNLLAEGFDVNKKDMSNNFVELGETIQSSLTERITKLDELMKNLPETVKESLNELLEEDKKQAEESLAIVEENNKRIEEIRKNAANNNRELTVAEGKILNSLNRESSEAYINTLKISQKEKENILTAMTGDVENATKDQAKAWAVSLGEQRQEQKKHYNEQKEDYLAALKELGYSDEAIAEQEKVWEKANEATTQGIDQQLAIIAEKYPEIAKEISLTNGQTIASMGEMGDAQLKKNNEIINSAKSLSDQLAESAEKNAEILSWTADEAETGAETWNSIVLDPKTGEVKTNVREEVIEASKESENWNHIRFQLKNADLDSNAKQIIGEAAIQNGWWEGMSWEEKSAIINDEFSETIIRSLEDSGKWNEMELEEQKALMYSNSPEKMTEALGYLGLWDEYEPEIKDINADNYGFIQSIMESEEKMAIWKEVNPDTKEILGNNYDLLSKIFASEESLNRFKELPDEQKAILGDNADLLSAVTQSEVNYNRWLGLPEKDKKFLGENSDLLNTVLNSETEYNRWLGLPEKDKKILGNNTDLLNKVLRSEQDYNDWKRLPEFEKELKVNNSKAVTPTENAINSLTDYKYFSPGSAKNLNVNTNAPNTRNSLQRTKNTWGSIRSGTKTFTTVFKTVGNAVKGFLGYEKGTNYHPGGPAIVNDQVGSKFREMVSLPNGKAFIPSGRNVLLGDLPTGSKVFKASLTEKMFPGIPQYANGVGIPKDSTVIQNLNRVREATQQNQSINVNNDFSGLETLLRQMLNVISRQQPKIEMNFESYGDMDPREISQQLAFLTQIQERGSLSSG
ncbi:phage tail tape measure protein [Marinilactibacillus psychrotolerans]|uniref:Phage tail tape measure protein n=1 Tax=Marinilactibacillus psychrotolerans TaxID=191770 RepID=A0AAV3WTA9_9LACT|nr:phage tail tape measure protein [Marinilactibacillus psychrotolerans]GEL67256.1 hypothetical protein MPS01_14110 [Marinilactibacillus psychrotolerans]GEQ36060.1 phage tail tape measure protein [Marinilactibacillus psychrotolerans]SDC61912.1 phage tail tape measure protein, TP901 family, core region [Marinilactibacillus psychrotolerans]